MSHFTRRACYKVSPSVPGIAQRDQFFDHAAHDVGGELPVGDRDQQLCHVLAVASRRAPGVAAAPGRWPAA